MLVLNDSLRIRERCEHRSLDNPTICRSLGFRLHGPGLQVGYQPLFREDCSLVATRTFLAGHETDRALKLFPIRRELLKQSQASVRVEYRKSKALLGEQLQYFSRNLTCVGRG